MALQFDLKKICQEIEKKSCRVHNKKPTANVVDGKINVAACCEAFHKECEKAIDDESLKQIDDQLFDGISSGTV